MSATQDDSPPNIPAANSAYTEELPLKKSGYVWRAVSALLVFSVLAVGQVVNTNDWFPLGSLSQYSYGRPSNTPTKSIRIIATTTEGKETRVPLNNTGVGIGRAEVEGQLDRILAEPYRLEGLARAWNGLHPNRPQYTKLRVERTIAYVENGKPTGDYDVEVLTTWDVQGNYGVDK